MAIGVSGRLRPRIFSTFGTTRVVGRQPNAPAAVQEKYRREKACDKGHPYRIIIIIIIIQGIRTIIMDLMPTFFLKKKYILCRYQNFQQFTTYCNSA